jgi:hypothetical protein
MFARSGKRGGNMASLFLNVGVYEYQLTISLQFTSTVSPILNYPPGQIKIKLQDKEHWDKN